MAETTTQAPPSDPESRMIEYKDTTGKDIKLSWGIVRDFFLPTATKQIAYAFMGFCKATGLNPFLREVYLSEFQGRAQIIVAYQTFMKRAERAGKDGQKYKGFEAGIVILPTVDNAPPIQEEYQVKAKGVIPPFIAIEGAMLPPGYRLAGGWCIVHREDRDFVSVLPFEEYEGKKQDGTVTRMWKEKKCTMMRKVPIGQAHRDAYPDETAGFYLEEEFSGGDPADRAKPAEGATEPGPRTPPARTPAQDMRATFHDVVEALGWTDGQWEMWFAQQREPGLHGAQLTDPEEIALRLEVEMDKAGVKLKPWLRCDTCIASDMRTDEAMIQSWHLAGHPIPATTVAAETDPRQLDLKSE